jgi:hypothetical protein
MASEPTRGTSECGQFRGKGRTCGTKRAGAEIMAPERKRAATSKGEKQTLCQKHADEIHVLLLDKQLAPAKIAETLCVMNAYPPHTITPKQVSNCIRYNVQEGAIKPPPVTGTAVHAEWTDDCMSVCVVYQFLGKEQGTAEPFDLPDTPNVDTLKDIPEEEEDFSQEFQMR